MPGSTAYPDTAPRTKLEEYRALKSALWSTRATFDARWGDLAEYIQPWRTRFQPGDRNQGGSKNQKILDSTTQFSARTLQSGLHAGLTSPARPWLRMTTPDPNMAERPQVKTWLHTVTERMRAVFQQTNLYNILPIIYGDLGTFGTAAMAVLEDDRDLFRCYTYPIGSYAVALDSRGRVGTFVVEYERTVREVVEEFGFPSTLPETVRKGREPDWSKFSLMVRRAWERKHYDQPVTVCWVVTRNYDANPEKFAPKYRPWTSCHFELDTSSGSDPNPNGFLRESGFHEFPVMVPRWDLTGGDSYGTNCPGMMALGDVKSLQILQKRKAQAIEKSVNPPLIGPSFLKSQKVSAIPGGITYEDLPQGQTGLRPIYEVSLQGLQFLLGSEQQTQYRIQRAYFEDLFLMLATSDRQLGADRPTAREIDERHEEKLLALGPVLERTNDELLDPLVDRVYAILERAGLIPEPPEELQGVKLKVEYISVLHQAQKLVGVAANDRFLSSTLSVAEALPDIVDRLDADEIAEDYADKTGVPPQFLRSRALAEQMRQQRNQMIAAQQQAEIAKSTGQAAQAAGSARMDEDTLLKRVVEGGVPA